MTFETDAERRAYFTQRLEEKLKDPEFRALPGFPSGSDEAILSLSDPPYYTACPNPFLGEIVQQWRDDAGGEAPAAYSREPFCSDVTEGKGGKLYKAHTYHTKVPPQAIAKFILHYTSPGDIVLDGFAGSGMTGLGAALCAHPDTKLKRSAEGVTWGPRRVVLVDLSPFATFLTDGANYAVGADEFERDAKKMLSDVRATLGTDIYGKEAASYLLWSQVFLCPSCSAEIEFLDVAVTEAGTISSKFSCPSCSVETSKTKCTRKLTTLFDPLLGEPVTQTEYRLSRLMRLTVPVLEVPTQTAIDTLGRDCSTLQG